MYYAYTFDPSGSVVQKHSNTSSTYAIYTTLYDTFGVQLGSMDPGTSSETVASKGDAVGFGGQWGYYTDNEVDPYIGAAPQLRHPFTLNGARYYDPSVGRFLTRDPVGYAGGINLYTFCGNNPINYADPSGLDAFDSVSNFIAGVGDSVAYGLTEYPRRLLNRAVNGSWDDPADKSSTAYSVGEWTETGVEITLTLGSAGLTKLAEKKGNVLARKEASEILLKRMGKEAKSGVIAHHINPLSGHPINLTKGKVISTVFPTRGLPGFIHSSRINIKLFPKTAASRAAHMLAHSRTLKVEKIYRAVVNPVMTSGRILRNVLTH